VTSEPNDLPPDAYHDVPWPQVLPWLSLHAPESAPELSVVAPSPDWWLTESPAVTTMAVNHEDLCRRLARMFVIRHSDTIFDDGFPTLPVRLPLAALPTGARARTAFQRLQVHTVGDLGTLSVQDLYGIRGTGQGTVEDIVTALVSTAITRPAALGASIYDDAVGAPALAPGATFPPAQLQLLEDLTQLADWRHVRNDADVPLFNLVIEDGAPEQIQEVALRINSLTASDIAPRLTVPDPLLDLTSLLSQLDERQTIVLRERLLARQPRRLAALGEQLDVSRERIRQIEAAIKELLASTFHFGTTIGNLLASLRVEIQPIARLDRLVGLHPELAREVPGLDVPFWLILDRLDDYFEVTDGWAAAPDVSAAADQTRTLLEDFANEHGLVELAAVAAATTMSAAELRDWLAQCGYVLYNDHILTRTRSMGDHAAGLLAAAGEPLHLDELHLRMGKDRSIRSLANTLADDERFVRTDRSTWALAGWQVEEYTSIRQLIGLELAAAGGQVGINELVQSITGRFDVSPNSVYTYASAGDYEVIDGVAQRRERAAPPRKEPAGTRRLFQHGATWKLRMTVTRDHLRGSGFSVPAAVAKLLGCHQGSVVQLNSSLGTQNIRWTGLQPSSGTIKRFLDSIGAEEGQIIFLVFLPDGGFDVHLMPHLPLETDSLRQAMVLIGAAATEDLNGAPALLAGAVGLPQDAKPRRILSAYYQRGDDDVAGLLERAWTRPHHTTADQLTGDPSAINSADHASRPLSGPAVDDEQVSPPHETSSDSQPRHHEEAPQPGSDQSAISSASHALDTADSTPAWVPVPDGYRSVGWVRSHEAQAAIEAYRSHTDFPVQEEDQITGWARYHDDSSPDTRRLRANVLLVREYPGGERFVCWIRDYEAAAVVQAAKQERSVPLSEPGRGWTGRVEYFPPSSQEAQRYRSTTRLLRIRGGVSESLDDGR
jgi:hypothetical protein